MSSKNKTGTVATSLAVISFILVLIAFVTPCWLENDSKVRPTDHYGEPRQDFVRLGNYSFFFLKTCDDHHVLLSVSLACLSVFSCGKCSPLYSRPGVNHTYSRLLSPHHPFLLVYWSLWICLLVFKSQLFPQVSGKYVSMV